VAIGSITLNTANGLKIPPSQYRHLRKSEINFLQDSFNSRF
ncbi:MAG: hypothetical protein RLZZ04_1732, partial [Cyanobacteriota bacterium]